MSQIHHLELPNGLNLVAQPMPGTQSLAMTMLLPAGAAHEPQGQQGIATVLSEMICRGAGKLDAKTHSDALDLLGVQRSTSVDSTRLRLDATMIGSKLPDALPLLLDMILAPALPGQALAPSCDLAIQAIESLDDEPQQKVFHALRQKHDRAPYNRSPLGSIDDLKKLTHDDVIQFHKETFVPGGSVLALAGNFDWQQLASLVHHLVDHWEGRRKEPVAQPAPRRGYTHVEAPTGQVHIGLAYDAVEEADDASMLQRAAVEVLSGGMSGRLFTQVREKRGLCYAVYASYNSQKHRAAVLSYAGTTAPRAQETLDVLAAELRGLAGNVTQSEFQRAMVGMKSRLVMQGESTGARASAIASDIVQLGRARTLDQLAARVDALTLDDLNAWTADHLPGRMTLVTIGPDPLDPASMLPADERTPAESNA